MCVRVSSGVVLALYIYIYRERERGGKTRQDDCALVQSRVRVCVCVRLTIDSGRLKTEN